MRTYNFANLSPHDFEGLVRALLEEELGLPLERFSSGRDSGVDLRYSAADDGALIVQCKHYPNSSFSDLLRAAKKEVPKVRALSPRRYKLATSSRLTPERKETLYKMFAAFMVSAGEDVYGEADINVLLERYPHVEVANFKLWLTSVEVLQAVLHNAAFVRTRGLQDSIENKLRIYVQSESFPRARSILGDHHVCVIAGVPGIGKTMLADMLLVSYLDEGFAPVVVSDDISEAFDLYRADERQIFYYDDFLGQTTSLAKLGKNEDARLLNFIEQVRKAGNKRLILTTREYILNQARARYEKLSREDFHLLKCVVSLDSYTRFAKAKILYNHLYFSNLAHGYHAAIRDERAYIAIIDHRNYSPRIIQSVVALAERNQIEAVDFVPFFLATLDKPEDLWRHAFENQLDAAGQAVLLLLASMPPDVDVEKLRVAFHALHQLRGGSVARPDLFIRTLRALEDNFVTIESSGTRSVGRFHNPSIRDFLHQKLDEESAEYVALVRAAQYFDQVELLARYAGIAPLDLVERSEVAYVPTFANLGLVVAADPLLIMDALRRTLDAPECGVSVVRAGSYRVVSHAEPTSPESRLRFALYCARRMGLQLPSWLIEAVEKLSERWVSGLAVKDEALALIEELDRAGAPTVADEQLTILKDWFVESLEDTRDFEALASLRSVRPSLIPEEEHDATGEDFLAIAEHELHRIVNSASGHADLEQRYDELDAVARYYGLRLSEIVDIEAYEEALEDFARAEDWEPDDEDHWREQRGQREEEGIAIDSLFDTLGN